jgi:hypothetical protein
MAAHDRARIEAYIGASGSGKGVSIKRRLAELKPARLLVWDPRNEYADEAHPLGSLGDLVQRVRQAGPGAFRYRFVPGANVRKLSDAFGLVCRLAFEAGSLVLLAEELSDVTQPSWAPPAWRQVTTQGRHHALHVIGAAQRPAMVDKAFLANCTRIRCGALGYDADRRVMAAELAAPLAVVEGLASIDTPGGVALQLVERDRQARTLDAIQLEVSRAGKVRERRAPLQTPTAATPLAVKAQQGLRA